MAPNPTRSSRSEQLFLFGRNFLKHPRMLGSLIPSSRFLVSRLLGSLDWSRPRVVVEYGPGVGTMTREILRRMPAEARLVAIETNVDFVAYLRRTIRDGRLEVVHGSAANADRILDDLGLPAADYVISGIPYSTMPAALRDEILDTTHARLQPHGVMAVFQFNRAVLPHLRRVFRTVEEDFEPLNIMPARLFRCRREPERILSSAG
jgi:phospholipid N-methyltransferase